MVKESRQRDLADRLGEAESESERKAIQTEIE